MKRRTIVITERNHNFIGLDSSICIKAQVYKDKDDGNDSFIGITSNDCVVRIKKVLNRHDIGHGGTLDKNAEGILPIAVGSATKLLQVC